MKRTDQRAILGYTPEGYAILSKRSAYTLPWQPAPGSCVAAWEMEYCARRGLSYELMRGGRHR